MKLLSFPTTLAAAIVCGAVVAACTSPPIGDSSNGSAVTGNDGSSGTAKKSTKTPTTSPTATIPLGDDDDDDDSAPPAGGGKNPVACMTKCIGSDAAAKTIYTAYATCESKCQKGDSACDDKCNGDVNTACDAQPDACQTVDGCSSKCTTTKGGSSSGGSSSGGGGGLTFADVQSLFANDCSSCHHHQGQFGTLADVQASQQDILDKIQSGAMPPSDANFAQGDDGQKILSWLQNGTDLQ